MKPLFALVALAVITALFTAAPARADNRVFIVANQSDGYGIDQCLASGDKCGVPAARSYCQSREFTEATAFRRVDPDEITGALPSATGKTCRGAGCAEFVAITCQR
ncbi:MAG TPA: hypothetical protein VN130_03795 [Xanthobacteraceae bacterium]|nr:hypothetical protein [Xanthobacteraceae bacterium]